VIQKSRIKIVWVGNQIPVPFQRMASDWGLTVVSEPPPVAPADPALRALLIWHTATTTPMLLKRLRKALPALDHGVFVGIVAEDGRSFETALNIGAAIATEIESNAKEAFEGIRILRLDDSKGTKWSEIVRECVHHDPGPAANPALKVTGRVDSIERLLFQRAFSRFEQVYLKKQSGGRSGSSVWRVDAFGNRGQRCEPFIAKVGARLALKEERDTFRENVRDFLPFPFRPSMMSNGYVSGATRAVLCSMFISRAQCFDKYVCLVQYPELVVSALFDGPLRTWRAEREVVTNSLGRVYVERGEAAESREQEDKRLGRPNREVLPKRDRLIQAYHLAKKKQRTLPTPVEVWDALQNLPALQYMTCPAHGDLNARNVFVRSTSVDVVLIDFSHASDRSASSRDPSRLDVNLAFDVGWKSNPRTPMLADRSLKRLYTAPLLDGARLGPRHATDGRIEAIRQIRHHVAGEGISEEEYRITTACHLLRYARADGSTNTARREFGKNEERRLRSLSYELAVRLLGL